MPTTVQREVGRYRLEILVGKGGMAEVYRATDTRLDRTVALKMVLPSLVSQRASLDRFLREARLVAALDHPNILPIYDFGEQDGVPYLVTPLMTGGTLAERVSTGRLPADRVVALVAQLGAALDSAHAAGILHRDVKPSNVLMDRNDRPVLADFGLARTAGAVSDLTATGVMVGTPLYMAPELAQGAEASPASDLYALGVLAYQMLCGVPPFNAETPLAVLHQHVSGDVPPLTGRVEGLLPSVDAVLARALAKQPEMRFASGAELARALSSALRCDDAVPSAARIAIPAPETARPTSEALIDGTLSVTPVPAPASAEPARATARARGRVVLVVFFAALGILLGSRSLVGRAKAVRTAAPATVAAPTASSPELPSPVADGEGVGGLLTTALRRPHRLGAEEFETLARRARAGIRRRPGDPSLEAMATFADAGLAYVRGDDAAARDSLDRVRQKLHAAGVTDGVPGWLADDRPVASMADWEVAAIFGDARGTGLPLVEEWLAEHPDDLRACFGRALLLHLDGRHEEAARQAMEVHERLPADRPDVDAPVMRLIADELVELGRWEEAVATYRELTRMGDTFAARAGWDGGRIALEQLGDRRTARELFEAACSAGNHAACERLAVARRGRPRSQGRAGS